MPDAVELVRTIKKAATDAVNSGKPVEICAGTVTSVKPLSIQTEQKLPLKKAQLILTQNVTDFETEISVSKSEETEEAGDEILKIKVRQSLKKGDKVIMLRQQGGQKYIVLDRIGVM